MQISISGQHINVGNPLQIHVKERLIQIVQKYFDDIINSNVHFTKDADLISCNITLNDSSGKHIMAQNQQTSQDIYHSFDSAVLNLEKQLRKHKSRLKDRHDRVKVSEMPSSATKYVLNSNFSENEDQDIDNPVIVAEKPVEIETLSVSEAVMVMDLKNLPALMFYNVKNGRINTVYYRKDGNISWIDSK